MQLIDCQNLFCETDKYSRVAHPNIKGLNDRTRIKQKFVDHGPMPTPFFPPKWGVNTLVANQVRQLSPGKAKRAPELTF